MTGSIWRLFGSVIFFFDIMGLKSSFLENLISFALDFINFGACRNLAS